MKKPSIEYKTATRAMAIPQHLDPKSFMQSCSLSQWLSHWSAVWTQACPAWEWDGGLHLGPVVTCLFLNWNRPHKIKNHLALRIKLEVPPTPHSTPNLQPLGFGFSQELCWVLIRLLLNTVHSRALQLGLMVMTFLAFSCTAISYFTVCCRWAI